VDSEGLRHVCIATAPTHYRRLFHAGVFFQPRSADIAYVYEPLETSESNANTNNNLELRLTSVGIREISFFQNTTSTK